MGRHALDLGQKLLVSTGNDNGHIFIRKLAVRKLAFGGADSYILQVLGEC